MNHMKNIQTRLKQGHQYKQQPMNIDKQQKETWIQDQSNNRKHNNIKMKQNRKQRNTTTTNKSKSASNKHVLHENYKS